MKERVKSMENKEEQKEVLDEIIEKRLNVRDTEDLINRKLNGEEEIIRIPSFSQKEIPSFEFPNYISELTDTKTEENVEVSSTPIKEYKEKEEEIEVMNDNDEEEILNVPSLSIAKKEKNIDDVISKIQKVVEEVKDLGFEAKLEEYDFDGLYQFVIKVDNEN